jgi:hypothetical protein
MSQRILDDQFDVQKVVAGLKGWITSTRLQDLRPAEHILDDRIPELLLSLRRPTFVTIDQGFWNRRCATPGIAFWSFSWPQTNKNSYPFCCGV